MYISSTVHHKESCLKLRCVSIIECSSQGKLFKVAVCIYYGVFISSKVFKVAVCIYHQVFISRKVVQTYGMYIMACSSQGVFKVLVSIYHQGFITRKAV